MSTISIREIKLEDYDQVEAFLSEQFYKTEPLMLTPGENTTVPAFESELHLSVIRQGHSLVAIDETQHNRIVGVALAEAQEPQDLEQACLEIEQRETTCLLDKIHKFLSRLEKRADIFQHFGVDKALYLYMLGVDTSVRRQGLGRRLVKTLIERGQAGGFPVIYLTCTNEHSTSLVSALELKCVESQDYADYTDEQGRQMLQPPAPHTKARVMAKRL